ncbi:hypothetical protein V2G26_016984 [Clonostachys chloroleuca]
MASDNKTAVIQWVLDTRKLWPQATQTSQLRQYAARALELLTPTQREDALRYVHCKDAKMALGSQLLKRYLISRYAGVAWDAAVATRNKDTKPVFLHPDDGSEPLIFNVSHQAGLVVVAAALHPPPGSRWASTSSAPRSAATATGSTSAPTGGSPSSRCTPTSSAPAR